MDVIFDLSINQILAVNERQRSMRIKLTTFLIWTDCRLSWSLERFAIRELHLSIEQFLALGIYVPILLMTEEITPEASKATERSVSVASSGMLHIERMYTTELSCAIDISMYPFDTQVCNITFESVLEKAYVGLKNMESASRTNADGYAQYLSLHHLGMGHFIPSDTWEVVIGPSDGHSRNICVSLDLIDGRGKCLYDVVVHQIVLRRHPTYQLWNLLLPAFLIVIISGCVFLVPPNTSDKMSLSITILLSLFIFMQIMYYKMPETGETLPLLSKSLSSVLPAENPVTPKFAINRLELRCQIQKNLKIEDFHDLPQSVLPDENPKTPPIFIHCPESRCQIKERDDFT